MHSLRTRITMLTVGMLMVAVLTVTIVSVLFIRNNGQRESEQLLLLLCETGERNLDYYFESVQRTVRKVANFTEEDITGLDNKSLSSHIERTAAFFEEIAYRTNGVLTYYYRIDPAISSEVKGFWYTNMDGDGFVPHEVTDITQYDLEDTEHLVWFTVPRKTAQPIWLPPYITDNLDVKVISYNIPIYWRGRFVGVVGIEIDYTTMAEQVESIRLFKNGYAFLSDAEGNIFFHPRMNMKEILTGSTVSVPDGLISESTFLRYTFEGVEKRAAWLPLSNGMRLNVCVPVSETDGDWQHLVWVIIIISSVVLLSLSLFTLYYMGQVVKPVRQLTLAAEEVEHGNYDIHLTYHGNDELGLLTSTFQRLVDHMKNNIIELNKRASEDALTSVKNKGVFTDALQNLQSRMEAHDETLAYAVGVFDCNDLKLINDRYGHNKGDIYLMESCRLICRVFHDSPVYRIGGDEFATILQGHDFENRTMLADSFQREMTKLQRSALNRWEQVSVAIGIAAYDPALDASAVEVVQRADHFMYANKRASKRKRTVNKSTRA